MKLMFWCLGRGDVCTDKQYGDFEMCVDWMLDPLVPEADAKYLHRELCVRSGSAKLKTWKLLKWSSGSLYNNQAGNKNLRRWPTTSQANEQLLYQEWLAMQQLFSTGEGSGRCDPRKPWGPKLRFSPVEQLEYRLGWGSKVYYRNIYVKELGAKNRLSCLPKKRTEGRLQGIVRQDNMHQWTRLIPWTMIERLYLHDTERAIWR